MTQIIQNGISSLENLFAIATFRIPQYQRAYSWEEDPHLEAFIDDLRQQAAAQRKSKDKQYFLGTLLLHEEEIGNGRNIVNIVDGQQRMTTSVVFFAAALALIQAKIIDFSVERPALIRRSFVYDEDSETQKFKTIQEDEPFFQSSILGISAGHTVEDSPSTRRLKAAFDYFSSNVQSDEWEALIGALKTAKVMVYAVTSAEEATQIFELQNDRGKSLTSLEALKSFLMHCIYLHSKIQADNRLGALQIQFSKIFRTIESLAEWKRTPSEDQLLSNHCAAFLVWTEKEYNNPKHLVKAAIKAMNGSGVIAWIESFVSSLSESFLAIQEIFQKRDALPEFSELLLLGRMGSFWPLVLKTWRLDDSPSKKNFCKTCRLLEVFAFRGYAVANLRADTSLSSFQTEARDFEGDFEKLFTKLVEMSEWHDVEKRFLAGLDNTNFYAAEGDDAHYFLWRYENHLRSQKGKVQPLLSWRDFVEPRSFAAKLSVEHVAAQDNLIASTSVVWGADDPKPFHEVALHRLGNLVIDSVSPNSSKGKKDFSGKLKSLSENSIYLSQGELINFLADPEVLEWDVVAIQARHAKLIAFARQTWTASNWHGSKV